MKSPVSLASPVLKDRTIQITAFDIPIYDMLSPLSCLVRKIRPLGGRPLYAQTHQSPVYLTTFCTDIPKIFHSHRRVQISTTKIENFAGTYLSISSLSTKKVKIYHRLSLVCINLSKFDQFYQLYTQKTTCYNAKTLLALSKPYCLVSVSSILLVNSFILLLHTCLYLSRVVPISNIPHFLTRPPCWKERIYYLLSLPLL